MHIIELNEICFIIIKKKEIRILKEIRIYINSIEQVLKFSRIVVKYEEDIDMISGRFKIDAKSIMGIFALDLSKPVQVSIISDNQTVLNKFEEDMEEFKY